LYDNQAGLWEDKEMDLLGVALEASDISGVIGVRIFGTDGKLIGRIPTSMHSTRLEDSDTALLRKGESLTRHYPRRSLDTIFADASLIATGEPYPVTEVLSPIMEDGLSTTAIIQYLLDGEEISQKHDDLVTSLWTVGFSFFIAGGVVFLVVFLLARQRLLQMGQLLAQRNKSLEQANADLAMAARTSAIGSVTSHLFHGLKNPLAGLKTYLKVTQGDQEVLEIADRMQALIDDTLAVIRHQEHSEAQELTMDEFGELARSKLNGEPNRQFQFNLSNTGKVSSHKAQLLLLVLRNLIENAVEASPENSDVMITIHQDSNNLISEVRDNGPGLPQVIQDNIFEPVHSSKEHGTGIGLAISNVLATHIPAKLTLVRTGKSGTTFSLTMPL
jgi:signal transduction histidine kinase